jgi:redox-regulated HSP33 family molecular chaperone
MPHTDRIGEMTIRRSLDRQRVLALAEGHFDPLFRAYDEHVRRWELTIDGLALAMACDGLAAAALHVATRPPDETVGITVNIQHPPLNLFLAGDTRQGTVTGRIFTEGVRTAPTSRLFVESYRPDTGPVQSSMDVTGLDLFRIFEDYYARSEQLPARFFSLGGDHYGLVRALPDGGRERVEDMSPAEAAALFQSPLDPLEEKTIRFHCGCTPVKILRVLQQMFENREDELFGDALGVEAFCPRCGARWWIERSAFETKRD